MEEDEGKGVKRKNDDSAALLPTQETQESTNNQEELQDDGDVQMQDAAVALPNKVDNDKANLETLKKIIENNLVAHSDSPFCHKCLCFEIVSTNNRVKLNVIVNDPRSPFEKVLY